MWEKIKRWFWENRPNDRPKRQSEKDKEKMDDSKKGEA
jgi:hypothetical protein